MDYLLKTSAIILIFYGFYKLILQRETFFQSNRWFLLIGILTALLVPLIVIPIYVEQPAFFTQGFSTSTSNNIIIPEESIDWIRILQFIYFGGVLFFGGKFIFNLVSLKKLITSHPKEKNGNYNFIKTDKNTSPFSFFSFIVFNPNQFKNKELEQIIIHEKVHAHQLHSIDILISQIVSIIFWFNPFVWLYKKEVQQNLEFIADDLAQQKSTCEKSYQRLLLKSSLSQNQLALTNNFYNSLIKKRIIMLHKNRSKSTNQWKYALILPLIAFFMMSFNTEKVFITKGNKVFTVSPETTTQELKNIEKYFKNTSSLLKFTDIRRNSNGEINNISINTKYDTDKRFYKRMTVGKKKDDSKIEGFNLTKVGSKIVFSPKDKTNNSIISNNKISFSEDFTVSKVNVEKETETIIITKDSKKSDFNKIKKEFSKEGVTANFKNIKRNSDGEITGISITVKSKQSNANYSTSSDSPIKPISLSFDNKGDNISIGNSNTHHGENYFFVSDDKNHKIHSTKKGNSFVFISDDKDIHKDNDGKHKIIEIDIDEDNDGDNSVIWVSKNGETHKIHKTTNSTVEIIRGGDKDESNYPVIITNTESNGNTAQEITYPMIELREKLEKGEKIIYFPKDSNYITFINGKEVTKKELDKLDSNKIEKMEVIKGDKATKKYGEKAKDGVILITTKGER